MVKVPIRNWPVPAYLHLRGALCRECACAFTLAKYGDYDGDWYDRIADELRGYKKPAVNPFPNNPDFKWEEFILHPHFDPVPKEECVLAFWKVEVLTAKGMSQRLWGE